MRVLISGSTGFVGKHFVDRLLADGHTVVGVDKRLPGKIFLTGNFIFEHIDLREWVKRWTPEAFDLIIHCAAVVGGRMTIEHHPLLVATDLAIDSDFFNWISVSKQKQKVVYFSSSAVYPIELQQPNVKCALSESLVGRDVTRIGRPDMTYGWAKLTGEYLAQQAVQRYGCDVVIYRPFSGYGEDQDTDYPFPSIIRRVANREDPIVVWGSGEQVRDFIHIDDIVEGVLSTMNVLKPGQVLNLGTGIPCSMNKLARLAGEEARHIVLIVNDATKPEGVAYRVCDNYLLDSFYKPKITLREGVRRALDYFAKQV